MAVTTINDSNTVTIKLNMGVDSEGKLKTANMNLTGIKKATFTEEDKQKLLNIVNALRPNIAKAVYQTILTSKVLLEEGE